MCLCTQVRTRKFTQAKRLFFSSFCCEKAHTRKRHGKPLWYPRAGGKELKHGEFTEIPPAQHIHGLKYLWEELGEVLLFLGTKLNFTKITLQGKREEIPCCKYYQRVSKPLLRCILAWHRMRSSCLLSCLNQGVRGDPKTPPPLQQQ